MFALVVALPLAWLSVRAAAVQGWAHDDPEAARPFWPESGDGLASRAYVHIMAAGGTVDGPARALTIMALRREPRDPAPLILAGLAASADGNLSRARALMEAARARDPEAAAARYWLLDHDIRSGDYAAALDEVGPAMRLRSGTHAAIFALLEGFLDEPAAVRALRDKLATNPDWRVGFFADAASRTTDPLRLLALLTALPPASDADDRRSEQRVVLYAVINRGAYQPAYQAWRKMLPPSVRPADNAVYDPDFAGPPGTPPFGWALQPGPTSDVAPVILADRSGRHGLSIAYRGGLPSILAEQYMIAAPGAYRFALRVLGNGGLGEAGSRLLARARCARGDALLVEWPIQTQVRAIHVEERPLSVPADCGAVRIQLAAEPGIVTGEVAAQITDVQLRPVTAS